MPPARIPSILITLRRAFLVVGVSCLAGLLVAAVALPVAAGLGLVARESATGFADVKVELQPADALPERSRILDADGNILATFFEENRVYVPLDAVAPVMNDAILAIEDHRFYEHGPIDLQGTARAFITNFEAGEVTGGGSTLTQQYAKLLLVSQAETDEERREATETSYARKLRELQLAIEIEQELTKDQILERYLNIVYFGDGAYGVEAAARQYFSTSAAKLTLAQAAMLAGLVQLPSLYDPTRDPDAARERRDVVLSRMADLGRVTDEEASAASAQDLGLQPTETPNGCTASSAPFFCDYVVQEILQMEELGATPEEREQTLRQGGLTITTTLDAQAQAAAEDAVADRVAPTDTAAAALASVEPGSGEIKAMTTSRGYGDGGGETYINYAVDQNMGGGLGMQAGSSFKPFVLAAAIQQGISVNTSIRSPQVLDVGGETWRTCDGSVRAPSDYAPQNSTGSGTFTMRQATARSVNTYFIQLSQRTGLCDPWTIATGAGLTRSDGEPLGQNPSFTLGPYNVSPLAMAEAYATFAARGVHCESRSVLQITDREGQQIRASEPTCNRVVEEGVADGVNNLLQGVMESGGGTGRAMRLDDGRDAAGKTGTTNESVAVWFVGYVPQLATAVGIADPDVDPESGRLETLDGRTYNGERIAEACGSCIPGPIWKQMMDSALDGVEDQDFVDPDPRVIGGADDQDSDDDGSGSGGGNGNGNGDEDRPGNGNGNGDGGDGNGGGDGD
jgi:membrane peptidoglycan carboxypeptidase